MGCHRFEWIQNSFNLIDQQEQVEMLDLCWDQGLGFTNFSPLCGGLLTGKYRYDGDYPDGSRMTKRPQPYLGHWNQQTLAALDKLGETAAEIGVSMAGLALGWLYHHRDVTSSIVDPRRPAHLDPVREVIGLELSQSVWEQVGGLFGEDPTE